MNDLRRDVRWLVSSARAFLRHFNPCDLAEDKSQQWQALSHQCDVVERALSAQPQPEAVEADEIQRAMDMLGDVPGDTILERVERIVSYHLALQCELEKVRAAPPLASDAERMRRALEQIKSLLSFANQDNVTRAARESNINSAWWQAHEALSGAADASNASAEARMREGASYNIKAIATVISLSYGEDPEADAELGRMCTADNKPVQCWEVYEEQAKALFVWFNAVLQSLSAGADEGKESEGLGVGQGEEDCPFRDESLQQEAGTTSTTGTAVKRAANVRDAGNVANPPDLSSQESLHRSPGPSDPTPAEQREAIARAALEQALKSLDEIAASHIPDCPAHYAGDELAWAQRHVSHLRRKAELTRDAILALSTRAGG